MPQADLKYSPDLDFDAAALLAEVEQVISRHDGGAGACKGRAYAASAAHHSHALLSVLVLDKPHRDEVFMKALLADLTELLSGYLPTGTERAVSLGFASPYYATGKA